MGDSPLACNGCWNKLTSKAFKTSCDHCYCEQCADQLFGDRRRRCAVCTTDVTSILEFQIVGAPILDEQLVDVRSTLQAIACANGANALDSWLSSLHRFERIQLALWGSRQGQASQEALREAEERERALAERDHQSRQQIASLEHECEQVRKDRDQAQRGVQDLQQALDERSRQADNWRAMYDAMKSGGRVTVPQPPQLQQQRPLSAQNRQLLPPAAPFQPSSDMSRLRSASMMSADSYHSNASSSDQHQPLMFRGAAPVPNVPTRSNTMPLQQQQGRPPTRESLASLLNRSVAPRTTSTTMNNNNTNNVGFRPQQQQQLHDPVRSTFFAPASLRAMSPAQPQQQPLMMMRGGSQQQGGGLF